MELRLGRRIFWVIKSGNEGENIIEDNKNEIYEFDVKKNSGGSDLTKFGRLKIRSVRSSLSYCKPMF